MNPSWQEKEQHMAIRIGIAGYGNLGRGVEACIRQNPDMEAVAVFTRRNPAELHPVTPNLPVVALSDAAQWKDKIDVMILCGGSATDLPEQTPQLVQWFHVVDSFDTHARIPEHFAAVDTVAGKAGKVGIISVGWDPGLFSLNRLYAQAVLPQGQDETFWGKGVSQGHSDAIRRVAGVKDARQYTIPVEEALRQVRAGDRPTLTARQKHLRECFVVAQEGADMERIAKEIKEMPNYFADYDTTVHFITEDQLQAEHAGIPHGGFVIRTGRTGFSGEHTHVVEYSLKLDSNPEFTSSVMTAYARAAYRLGQQGVSGCHTVFDIAPALLDIRDGSTLRKILL